MNFINLIASAEGHVETVSVEAEKAGLFESLGLDLKQLIINTVAFLILVAILSRFVFPSLIKAIDSRRETIEASLEEAKKTQEANQDAEKRIEALLVEARKEADEIVARSHGEAQAMITDAETKAKQRADRLVADARAQLDADVLKARTALKKDMLSLVTSAAEKVVEQRLNSSEDTRLIKSAIDKQTGDKA